MGASRLCANILFCIIQEFLSDGKENNEQYTSASLHLLEGEGDRAPRAHGGRGKYGSQTYSYAAQEFPLGQQNKKRAMHKREPALSKGGGTAKRWVGLTAVH